MLNDDLDVDSFELSDLSNGDIIGSDDSLDSGIDDDLFADGTLDAELDDDLDDNFADDDI